MTLVKWRIKDLGKKQTFENSGQWNLEKNESSKIADHKPLKNGPLRISDPGPWKNEGKSIEKEKKMLSLFLYTNCL